MKLVEQILENEHVRLEPLQEIHRDALRATANADPEIWISLYPVSMGAFRSILGSHSERPHPGNLDSVCGHHFGTVASRAIFDPKKSFAASILVAPTTHLKFVGAS
jgi:hypothetical protein